MFKIQTHYKVAAVFLFVLALGFLSGGKAQAASITVNTDINPSACTLDEAIVNINDGADTNVGCVETGTYGIDDTITIPEGTVLLTTTPDNLTKSVTIQGAGIGETIIDGDGQFSVFGSASAINFKARDLTTTGFNITSFYFEGDGIDVDINRVEVDGNNSTSDVTFYGGIIILAKGTYTISDVYIHDVVSNIAGVGVSGIGIAGSQGSIGSVSVSNATIENIRTVQPSNSSADGIAVLTGFIDGSFTPATINLDVFNSTITNISSDTSGATGVSVYGAVNGGETLIDVVVKNSTITAINGVTSPYGRSSAFVLFGGAVQSTDALNINYESMNNILASNMNDGSPSNCSIANANDLLPGAVGSVGLSVVSDGGNLADDTTCSPYLTQPTDQNNLTNLASTLGPLSDNGGYVPTMALLEGSPAIDSGVTVAGLTTDARQAVRPQGTAYDSGAYESPYTKPAAVTANLASTGQNTVATSLVAFSAVIMSAGFLIHTGCKKW